MSCTRSLQTDPQIILRILLSMIAYFSAVLSWLRSRGLVFQAVCQCYAITTVRQWVSNTTYTNKMQLDLDPLQNHPIPSHSIQS